MGIGALGCLLGAKLASVTDVTLIGHWPEQIAAIRENGLWLEYPNGERSNHVITITSKDGPIASSDLVLVAVKSHQTKETALRIQDHARNTSLVITLQNGLNNRAQLAELLNPKRVTLGVTSEGATTLSPGFVRHAGNGKTFFGRNPMLGGRQQDHLETIATLFQLAGLAVAIVDNVEGLLWSKLAVNAAINPLTALLGVPNGDLLRDPGLVALMSRVAGEVAAVAAAQGIVLPFPNAAEQAISVARATAANRSSMLQDISRGVATEIDAICGAIVTAGEALGVPTPLNARLFTLVKQLEIGELSHLSAGDTSYLLSLLSEVETGD